MPKYTVLANYPPVIQPAFNVWGGNETLLVWVDTDMPCLVENLRDEAESPRELACLIAERAIVEALNTDFGRGKKTSRVKGRAGGGGYMRREDPNYIGIIAVLSGMKVLRGNDMTIINQQGRLIQ